MESGSEMFVEVGKGIKLVKKEMIEFNKHAAAWLRDLETIDGDRRYTQRYVDEMVNDAKRGTFLSEVVTLAVATLNGVLYRVNGQHTAAMRLAMPDDWRCRMQLLRFSVDTLSDLRVLYSMFDQGHARSNSQVLNSMLFNSEGWSGIGKKTIQRLGEGIAYFLWDSHGKRVAHDGMERAVILNGKYYKLSFIVASFLDASKCRHLERGPVVGAMLATFEKSATAAREFWTGVRDGVGLPSLRHPCRILRDALMVSTVRSGAGAIKPKNEQRMATGDEMYRWCIHAWNAFRRNEELKQLKAYVSAPRPVVL